MHQVTNQTIVDNNQSSQFGAQVLSLLNLPPAIQIRPTQGQHAAQAKQKQGQAASVETLFGQMVAKSPDYARDGQVLHKWNGTYWEALNADDGVCEAMIWLVTRHPSQATPAKAESCFRAARMMAHRMPMADASRVIIPFENTCIEVLGDGRFRYLPHHPSNGNTYALRCQLPVVGQYYVPGDVPSNSLLGRYFDSSLPDVQVRELLQELAGDTLMPDVRFQVAALLKGKGRNGKSIYTRLLSSLHHRVAPMWLNKLSGFDLEPLVGASLAIVDELPERGVDQQTFKSLVSGETLTVNAKFQRPMSVRMKAKWVICTNNDQKYSENSDGFWRRLVIVPFDRQISEDEVIPGLDDMILRQEMVLFVDWCLAGLQRLLQRGKLPPVPQAVQVAKQQAIVASNNVLGWMTDCDVQTGNCGKTKDDTYAHYREWCYTNGYQPKASNKFWGDVKAHFGDAMTEFQATKDGKRVRMVNLAIA